MPVVPSVAAVAVPLPACIHSPVRYTEPSALCGLVAVFDALFLHTHSGSLCGMALSRPRGSASAPSDSLDFTAKAVGTKPPVDRDRGLTDLRAHLEAKQVVDNIRRGFVASLALRSTALCLNRPLLAAADRADGLLR